MDPVDDIKSRLAIEEVVGQRVELKRSGASYKGLCPFHPEKTPSFYVTPARGTFHCFGCGKGGDIFSFVMEAERLDFAGALHRLAEQAGVQLPQREPGKPSLTKQLHEINLEAANFYRETLDSGAGSRAHAYLESRDFSQSAIELFQIGFAPESRDALVQHLTGKGLDERILLAAGLAIQDELGGRIRDRFRGRIMLPIRDASGNVSGFGGRSQGDAQPKYLNSPQNEIFDKSSVLFGIQRAQDAIQTSSRVVLVEGYFDAIRAHISGFSYVVASLGTAVTPQQFRSLIRMTDTVIIALDPDTAGQSAAIRTTLTALAEVIRARGRRPGEAANLNVRVAALPPDGGDPDDLIRSDPSRWKMILDEAVPVFDFFYQQTMQSLERTSASWRQDAIDQLLPTIRQFAGSTGWQAVWMERLAGDTGVNPRLLQASLPASGPARRQAPRRRDSQPGRDIANTVTARALTTDHALGVEQALVALLLQLVVLPESTVERLESAKLEREVHRFIVSALLHWRLNENFDYQLFRETLPPEVQEAADELYGRNAPVSDLDKIDVAVDYYLARLEKFRLEAQLGRATELLREVSPDDARILWERVTELNGAQRNLEQTLEDLSRQVVQSYGTIDQESGRV